MPPTWGLSFIVPCLELPSHKNPQSFAPSLPSIYYSNVTLLVSPCEIGPRPTIFQLETTQLISGLMRLSSLCLSAEGIQARGKVKGKKQVY